ncbi:MAG: invasion associated locus B family protein [Alphaproteobacteria bacterium]
MLPLLSVAVAPAALAQGQPGPKHLGTVAAWHAYESGEGAARVCFVTSQPASSQVKPAGAKRDEIRLMVTHRPAQRQQDEVSFHAGYPVSTAKPVVAVVDKAKNFDFVRRSEKTPNVIWSASPDADKAIVAALRSGKELVVNGVSQRGSSTSDTFRLEGFGRALDLANRACGPR